MCAKQKKTAQQNQRKEPTLRCRLSLTVAFFAWILYTIFTHNDTQHVQVQCTMIITTTTITVTATAAENDGDKFGFRVRLSFISVYSTFLLLLLLCSITVKQITSPHKKLYLYARNNHIDLMALFVIQFWFQFHFYNHFYFNASKK